MSINTIRLTLEDSRSTIDSEEDYGVVTLAVDNVEQKEIKNISSQDWLGEDGEDVYIPTKVAFKPFDCVVTLGVKKSATKTARENKDTFLSVIYGKMFSLCLPYNKATLYGCYISKVEDDDLGEDYITFKVTFRVTKWQANNEDIVTYSTPTLYVEYATNTCSAVGGTNSIRSISYTQTKTIKKADGTTTTETITSGGTITFVKGANSSSFASVNRDNGTITWAKNTTTQAQSLMVKVTLTINGKVANASKYFTQEANDNLAKYYVGLVNATRSEFATMGVSALVANSVECYDQYKATSVDKSMYYIMLPSNVQFVSLKYTSSGIESVVTSLSEFRGTHSAVTIDGTTYNVYGYRAVVGTEYITYNLEVNIS